MAIKMCPCCTVTSGEKQSLNHQQPISYFLADKCFNNLDVSSLLAFQAPQDPQNKYIVII